MFERTYIFCLLQNLALIIILTNKTSLGLIFLSFKMGIVIVPTPQGFCEDQVN